MTIKAKQELKRQFISALVSFIAGFAIVIHTEIDHITLASFRDGSIVGTIFLAVRAGIKVMLEYVIPWVQGILKQVTE